MIKSYGVYSKSEGKKFSEESRIAFGRNPKLANSERSGLVRSISSKGLKTSHESIAPMAETETSYSASVVQEVEG